MNLKHFQVLFSSYVLLIAWPLVAFESTVVGRNLIVTGVGIKSTSHCFEEGGVVKDGLVDVVGAPLAIFCVRSDRSNQTPDALVNV